MLEEAAFIPKITMEDVVFPLVLLDKTTLIADSTLQGADSPFTQMLDMKHPITKQPIFKKVEMTMACKLPQCRANPEQCTHRFHRTPRWQSPAKAIIAKKLMRTRQGICKELLGISADEGIKAFDPCRIELMFTSYVEDLTAFGVVHFAITTVDPNNNGDSDYGMVTVLYTDKLAMVDEC